MSMATDNQSRSVLSIIVLQEQLKALSDRVLELQKQIDLAAKELKQDVKEAKSIALDLARELKQEVKDAKITSDTRYLELISKEEFQPIQRITYGLVGLVLTAFLSAVFTTVLRK